MYNGIKIVLIGNYKPDKQESMRLFAEMFYETYQNMNIRVSVIYPTVFFGRYLRKPNSGIGKWLSYLDKFILFPLVLVSIRINLSLKRETVHFHICDHSNSPYLAFLPISKTVITCHDVLAIRGSLGFKDSYCDSSFTGKIFQKWIFNNLKKAKKIAFVSSFTKDQFLEMRGNERILTEIDDSYYPVIYNSFNAKFNILSEHESSDILLKYNIMLDMPYLLHVGSDLPRKNKKLLINLIQELKESWNGILVCAGQDANEELKTLINDYNVSSRVMFILHPNHELMVALYNRCFAFVFPSFSEGFGWPLIEAQACGVPVITSDREPMIEVCGGAALHANPDCFVDFSKAFTCLKNEKIRNRLIFDGFKNIKRFEKEVIMNRYLSLYNIN